LIEIQIMSTCVLRCSVLIVGHIDVCKLEEGASASDEYKPFDLNFNCSPLTTALLRVVTKIMRRPPGTNISASRASRLRNFRQPWSRKQNVINSASAVFAFPVAKHHNMARYTISVVALLVMAAIANAALLPRVSSLPVPRSDPFTSCFYYHFI
jgi:hypothetical protein